MPVFGEILRELRNREGLSQVAFGEMIGYSRTQVSNWERLQANPPDTHVLDRIAKKLGLSSGDTNRLFVAAGYQPPYVLPQTSDAVAVLTAVEIRAERLVVGSETEKAAAAAFIAADLHTYLETIVATNETLNLSGTGGPVQELPLERVYVALKADPSNAAERQANADQFHAEVELALAARGLDARAQLAVMRMVAAGRSPGSLTQTMRDRGGHEAQTYLGRQAQRIDVGELAAQERWAVLLGDPGSGKTTLVRWLALQFAQALLADAATVRVRADHVRADEAEVEEGEWVELGPARLPVPLRLADYAQARWNDDHDSGLSLWDYMGEQPWQGQRLHPDKGTARALIQHHIARGQAFILLDGLDEITDRHRRNQVASAIEHFMQKHARDPQSDLCAADKGYAPWLDQAERPRTQGGNQVLVTSRVVGYYAAPLAPTLPHYTVEEMSAAAIGRFCRAWTAAVHEASGKGDPEQDAERLRATLLDEDRPGLAEIAANPLLLTILAGLYYKLQGDLPHRRVELYKQTVQSYLDQRSDAIKAEWRAAGLDDAAFVYAMGFVAVRLHASPRHRNAQVVGEQLAEWLEEALEAYRDKFTPQLKGQAEILLRNAHQLSGFLMERGDGVYAFIHRSFQEYFAARYLAWDKSKVIGHVCERLDEPAWRVPLILAVAATAPSQQEKLLQAILDAPDPSDGVIPSSALFLAECLPELAVGPPITQVRQVVSRLIDAYADRDWPPAEPTRVPEPLRQAIETALRPLQQQPGALAVVTAALRGADPRQRLAATELILETDWSAAELVTPLLALMREHAEPAATVREALLRCHQAQPAAFAAATLPMRSLLADPAQAASLWARPLWRGIVQALYLDPTDAVEDDGVPTPAQVVFDSILTPGLQIAWQQHWDDAALLAWLVAQVGTDDAGPEQRDAALALAFGDDRAWRDWLAGWGEDVTPRHVLAPLLWFARALALDLDLALARALALDRVLALDRDLVLVLALALDLDLALALALDLALDRALALARALARDLALDRESVAKIQEVLDAAANKLAVAPVDAELADALAAATRSLVILRRFIDSPALRALAALRNFPEPKLPRSDGSLIESDHDTGRLPLTPYLLDVGHTLNADTHARLQLPHGQHDLSAAIEAACLVWLAAADPVLPASAALLLAEAGTMTAATLPHLIRLLTDEQDLFRYRSREVLEKGRAASAWTRPLLEMLAAAAADSSSEAQPGGMEQPGGYLASTACGWALKNVLHDQPDWLMRWAEKAQSEETTGSESATTLLDSVHRLDEGCVEVYLHLLAHSPAKVQTRLLDSASWLLRQDTAPAALKTALPALLLRLSEQPQPVGPAAVVALGFVGKPEPVLIAELLARAHAADPPFTLWMTLARLAAHVEPDQRESILQALAAAPAAPHVDAALARLFVAADEDFEPAIVLSQLSQHRPAPASQLKALLAAGEDDDVWNKYHERVAECVRTLVMQHAGLFPALLQELRDALQNGGWQRNRMVLAALAYCAEAMPELFNRTAADLEPLLLQATAIADSFSARRFAITALSYLRVITPAGLAALLRLAADIAIVQEDAIAAAGRFYQLDDSLGETMPPEIVVALSGPSSVRAYVAVQLLAALGASPTADITPGLRQQILAALSTALRDENSRRAVWLYDSSIQQEGTLDQHLFTALLRVAGFRTT